MTNWDYWCPIDGMHAFHPNELQVGIVDDKGTPLLVAAVVPPLPDWNQMEGFASAMRDALASKDWKRPDGLEQWLLDKGIVVDFPNGPGQRDRP